MPNISYVHGDFTRPEGGREGKCCHTVQTVLQGDTGGMHLHDRERGFSYQLSADHKANNQTYLVKFEVNRSNIVSSNSCETKKSMFPGTTENNTFIMVEQTSNHSSYSWVHRKQIPCNEKAHCS